MLDVVTALAIVGLLAAIAVPSYRAQVVRAYRADARAALLSLAAAEESYYIACNTYAATLDESQDSSCASASLRLPVIAGQGRYTMRVTAADAAGWTATATATGDGPQAADERCFVLQLSGNGSRSARTARGDANDVECWSQ